MAAHKRLSFRLTDQVDKYTAKWGNNISFTKGPLYNSRPAQKQHSKLLVDETAVLTNIYQIYIVLFYIHTHLHQLEARLSLVVQGS